MTAEYHEIGRRVRGIEPELVREALTRGAPDR
jgi:hypothetical protein